MGADDRSVQSDKRTLGGHRHVCAFFNSLDEQYRVLRPFIKDGVDRGERALHIVDPELRDEHLKRLGEAGIDVERSMASGQLEVRLWQDAYLREDRFDQDVMLALIEEQLQSGAAAGSRRIRLMAHMEWSLRDKPGVDDLLEYEARLNYVLPRYDDPVICTYDLLKFSSSAAMDIMRTHPAVIIGGVLQENPFFVPPDQFLLEIRERRRHAEAQLRLAHDQLEMKVTERAGEWWQTSAELQTILDASPVGIVLFRRDQTVQRCSPAFERLVGWKVDEIVGRRLSLPESIEQRWTSFVAQLNRGERFSGLEIRIMRKDGSEFDAAVTCAPFTNERGRPAGFVANIEYITDRKRAEEALRRSETYLAEAQRLSHTGSWARDMATNEYTHSSDEYARLFGFDPQRDRPPRDEFLQRIHPEDRGRHDDIIAKAARERMDYAVDYRVVLPDGTMKCLHVVGHPVCSASGDLVQLVGTAMDVTERKRAEEERQAHLWFLESMDRVNRAIQGTNDLEQMMSDVLDVVLSVFECDRSWLTYPCDPEAVSHGVKMQRTRPEFPGLFAVGADVPVDAETADLLRTVRASSGPVGLGPRSQYPLPAKMAKRLGVQSRIVMALYPKGAQPYMFGLSQCSYARAWTPQEERLFQEIGRRLEDALTSLLMFRNLGESERRLEEAQRISHVGYWERDLATNRYTWSDENYRIFGLRPQECILTFDDVQKLLHPADREMRAAAVAEALRGGRRYDVEYRVVRPDGDVRFVRSEGDVVRDEAGRLLRVFGTVQDITERKRGEHRRMAQHTVTQILAEAATLEEATANILRAACESLVWDLGALWHTESVEVPEFEAAIRESTFRPGIGLPGRVWSSREPAFIADVVHDANFPRAPIAAREMLHAAFGVPILLGGEVLGVMEFFSHEIRQPDRDLLDMMATIGSQIGQFIERKRAEDALHHAQAELAHVTRVATLGELTASIAHEISQPLAAVVSDANACLHWLAAK